MGEEMSALPAPLARTASPRTGFGDVLAALLADHDGELDFPVRLVLDLRQVDEVSLVYRQAAMKGAVLNNLTGRLQWKVLSGRGDGSSGSTRQRQCLHFSRGALLLNPTVHTSRGTFSEQESLPFLAVLQGKRHTGLFNVETVLWKTTCAGAVGATSAMLHLAMLATSCCQRQPLRGGNASRPAAWPAARCCCCCCCCCMHSSKHVGARSRPRREQEQEEE